MKRPAAVWVEWLDAFYAPGPVRAADFDPGKGLPVVSAGLLIRDDPAGVTLSLAHSDRDDQYRDLLFIPRACITKIRRLK